MSHKFPKDGDTDKKLLIAFSDTNHIVFTNTSSIYNPSIAYNYVDIKPLRAIWGLTHYGEVDWGVAPTIYPR